MFLLNVLKEFIKKNHLQKNNLDLHISLKIKSNLCECHLTLNKNIAKLNFPGVLNVLAFLFKSKFLTNKNNYFNIFKEIQLKQLIIYIYNLKIISIDI